MANLLKPDPSAGEWLQATIERERQGRGEPSPRYDHRAVPEGRGSHWGPQCPEPPPAPQQPH